MQGADSLRSSLCLFIPQPALEIGLQISWSNPFQMERMLSRSNCKHSNQSILIRIAGNDANQTLVWHPGQTRVEPLGQSIAQTQTAIFPWKAMPALHH